MLFQSTKNHIVIDVTKPPYSCDPTGVQDCTEALCRALDDILIREVQGVDAMREKLMTTPGDNFRIGFENRKMNGVPTVIFPEDPPPARILYFPEGVYRITDTVTYSLENLKNTINDKYSSELNRFIRFKGAGQDKTVIRLDDNLHHFRYGENRPMIDFARSNGSNVSMMNSFEDITLDIGSGNTGAIGLRFTSVNTGHVRNVTILSSDPDHRGYAGYFTDLGQENLVENLTVDGFEYGIKMTQGGPCVAVDGFRCTNTTRGAIHLTTTNVTFRNVEAYSYGAGLYATNDATVSVLDSTFTKQGDESGHAIRVYTGHCYLRNVTTAGYREGVIIGYEDKIPHVGHIAEFNSNGDMYKLFPCEETNVGLVPPAFPDWEWDGNRDDVAEVDDFGAKGDAVTDSTAAIQAAMHSGKPYVVFGEGRYLVTGEITIPATVRAINFMYCDFEITHEFAQDKTHGLFAITEDSDTPLQMDDAFVFEKFYGYLRFIRHSAKRDLVVNDVHVQTGAFYFNTVPGSQVFMSNVASTMGVFGGKGYGATPCFHFSGQQVWTRQFNPERSADNCMVDNGSTFWCFGFKTEGPSGKGFTIRGGSKAEMIGGIATIASDNGLPCIENTESSVFAFFITDGCGPNHQFVVAVKETQNDITRCFEARDMPKRSVEYYKIAGYVGIHKDEA